jgi:[ribosomal protein S5]-alanine N-acetyltransferase
MIETEKLKLIVPTRRQIELYFESEKDFAEMLDVKIAENWLPFPEALNFILQLLHEDSAASNLWWMYFFIHKASATLIGNGGFKGAPDETGMVEIGYAIAPDFQNQGLATEAAKGFINFAWADENVKMIDAHTLAEPNASTKVLQKCGMRKIGEKFDEEDGDLWHWRILREERF